jgi:hypothetical protein
MLCAEFGKVDSAGLDLCLYRVVYIARQPVLYLMTQKQ